MRDLITPLPPVICGLTHPNMKDITVPEIGP